MWPKKRRPQEVQVTRLALPHFTSTNMYTTFSPTFAASIPLYPKLEPPKDLGLAIEPIVAVREFVVYMDGGDPILASLNQTPWPIREPLQAMCSNDPLAYHDAPSLGCTCGIFAWKKGSDQGNAARGRLWGEVYLWGDVLICDYGYRAEFAYPKELHLRDLGTKMVPVLREGLEELYGVSVTLENPPSPPDEESEITYNFSWGNDVLDL